jgi:hypothetical protein
MAEKVMEGGKARSVSVGTMFWRILLNWFIRKLALRRKTPYLDLLGKSRSRCDHYLIIPR